MLSTTHLRPGAAHVGASRGLGACHARGAGDTEIAKRQIGEDDVGFGSSVAFRCLIRLIDSFQVWGNLLETVRGACAREDQN